MGRYDDIINMEHHTSLRHPRMSPMDRAAQFAPFAALTGYEEVIAESGRLTDDREDLDEMQMAHLNEVMGEILERLPERPEVEIVRFEADSRKQGGRYVSLNGRVRNVDLDSIVLSDDRRIPLADICDLRIL